jgi:hypothetical protein
MLQLAAQPPQQPTTPTPSLSSALACSRQLIALKTASFRGGFSLLKSAFFGHEIIANKEDLR